MVENFTLFYLVDDTSLTPDILLTTNSYQTFCDEQVDFLLDLIEYDPGIDLVKQILQKAGVE